MDAFKNNLLILLEYFKHHYFNDSLYIHITDIQIQTSKQTELHHSLCIKGVNGFFIYANIQNTHRLTINSKVHSSICSNLHQISFDFKSNYTYNYNELLNIFVSNLPLQVLDNFHDYRFSIKLPYLHSFENSLLFLGAENNLRILQSHNFEIAHLTSKQNDCNAIENYLVNYLNKILINEIEEADMNTSFIQLGMDSLQTSLFEYEIQKRFEYLIIPNLLLLKYNTLTKLSHFLQQSCEKVEDKTHIVKKEKEIFYIKPTTNQIRYLFIKNINNSYFNSLIEGAQLKIGQTPDIINLQNKVLNLMASNMILRTIYTNQNKLEVLSLTESFIHLSLNDHIEPVASINVSCEIPLIAYLNIDRDKNVNLFFFCHHCACDGLSFQVIYNYLIDQFVFNKDSVQYSTFSTFEDNYFDSSNYIKDKEYWGSKLFSFSYCLYSNLKLNLLKPKNVKIKLSKSNFDVLQRLSTQTGCSFYSICLFAYRIAILKIHAIDNISIGIPCSGRIHNKFESVIGSFINPIPFIFNLHSSNTIRQEIQSHHKMLVSDLRHQALPFDQIKECSKLSGQLYDVMFIQETNILKHNISNVKKMLPLALECPQVWSIDTHVQHCEIHVSYSCDISKIEIENIIKEFDSVMKLLPFKLESSIKEMSSNYPLVAKDYPNAFPLFDILQKQADLSNTIVYNEDKSVNISLNNLLTKANFLSMTLNNEYFETFGEIAIRDIPIGIQSTRNINMLSMVLAIWKSGFAVLPINANSKLEQIKVLINSLIISEEKIAHIADEKYIYLRKNSRNLLNYTNIFYLTETSGTTGNSKLVCSEGEGLLNLVTNYTKLFYLTNTSKIYQVVNYAFDIFFADILKAFVNGSDIVLADDQIPKIQTFDSLNISHSYIMPAYISRLNKTQLGHLQSLKYLHYGGESLSAACLDFLYKLNIIVCQEYGSTEHAIYTNILQMRKNMNPLRIGNPIDNVGIVIYEENGVYQSNLSAGILFSYGIGLFRGYLYQDTRKPNFSIQENMNGLFTKDMVYHLNNKEIILKGRLDNQIKLDGIKVDLNEIQEILLKHSNISECIVLKHNINNQNILSVHYSGIEVVNHTILFKYLESKIFVNVIPKYYFYHEQFKLNSNGKIDRKYLHDLVSSQTIKNYGCKPVNDSYSNIVKTFAKFIHCPELEISDNLFEKGGTSISLMMAVHEVAEQFNYYINLTDIFEFKSLDKIINKAQHKAEVAGNNSSFDYDAIPLTRSQNYMWFDNEVSQHSDQYSIKWKIEFNRDVDSGLISILINNLIANHPSLRSILHITSKNIFQRLLSLTECYINFSTSNSVKEGIDLTNELPISIYHVSNRSFGIDFHHIAVDGHSLQLIRKNLFVMYKLLSTNLSITEHPKIKLNSCFAKFAFDNHQMTTRSREALQQSFFKSIKTNKYIQNICFNTNQFPKEDEFSTFITILVHVLNDLKTDERFQIFTPMSLRTPHFQNIVGNFVDTFLLDITSSNQISKDIQINKQHIANVMQNKNMQLASNMNASRIMFILDTFDNNDNFMLDNEVFVRIEEEVSLYSVYNQIWTIQKQENGIKLIINYSEEKYSSNTIIGYVDSYFKILDQMNSISMLNGITSLWEDVLEVDSDFDRHKSFFELGGNSISAAILCSNIRQKYRLDCYVSILFDNPLIDNFVNHLLSFGKNSKPQNIASNVMYQGNKISNHAYSIKNHFALPILKYLEKNINNQKLTNTYCNSIKVRIENVSLKAMNVKINNVLKIQPMLRSIFEYKNGTYHTLILSLTECFINLQNVSKYTAINYNYENLFEAPWFFAYLCNDFFILEVGHTCVDGFSIICLEKYLTNTPNLYSVNQLNQIKSSFNEINNIKIDTAYKNYLKECNEQTIKQNYLFNFDPELKIVSKKITILNFKTAAEQYLKQYQCSEFVLIYGIICESLMKSLNVSKLCILSTFDSRQIIYDLDKAVGMFVNVLPVLIQSPDQDHIREAISYMANRCHLDIEEYFNSNAQIMITQMNPVKGMKNKIDKKSKFDLTIFVETSDELNIVIQGSEKLFNTDWMQNLLVLIQEILTEKFQQTKQRDYPGNLTLLSILCKQAELTPYNFAIKTKLSCLTYSNLIEAITILCFNLQRQYFIQFGETIVPESIISFLASKSTDHILTILAILKCGAAYNPIDDKYPTERIDKILENCSTMLFFNNKNIIQIHKQTYFYFFRHLQSNLSYIINTSGTTGIPKAVCIGQEGLINMITESTRNFKLSSTDTVYQFTNLVYDNSVLEIFSTLCNGSSLYQSQQPFDSLVFVDEIREFQITHAMLFPGIIKTFNDDELLKMNILKYWIVGAEKLPQALLNKMIMNKVATIQNYGPTETTGYCIWRFMRSNDNAQCLGKPIANMKYRIIENELELSGIGLMWGYINNNTREWYKTGDLVSTINQNILFNCRKDKQIKIYGHRVELIEIEGIIELLDEIKECKAVFSESINIVYVGSTKLEHDYIIQHCKKYLPLYCLPKRSLKLEKIPLTSNNKVNEEEILNLINEGRQNSNSSHNQHIVENTIIQIWGKVLEMEGIHLNTPFFSVGGNSINGALLSYEMNKLLEPDVYVLDIYKYETIGNIIKNKKLQIKKNCEKRTKANSIDLTSLNLSYQQQQMYLLNQTHDYKNCNIVFAEEAKVEYNNLELWQISFLKLLANNVMLRTIYFENDSFTIIQEVLSLTESYFDLNIIEVQSSNELKIQITNYHSHRFDLQNELPVKPFIFSISNNTITFVLILHHIISDAWTTKLINKEMNCYVKSQVVSRKDPFQYVLYSQEEQRKQKMYQQKCKIIVNSLSISTTPLYFYRQDQKIEKLIFYYKINLSKRQSYQLGRLCDTYKITPFVTFLTLYIIHRQQSFVDNNCDFLRIAFPFFNRSTANQDCVGIFLNNVIMEFAKIKNQTSSFFDNCQHIQTNYQQMNDYMDVPWSFVQSQMRIENFVDKYPYHVYFNCRYNMEYSQNTFKTDTEQFIESDFRDNSHPIQLNIDKIGDDWSIEYIINSDVTNKNTADKMFMHFEDTLKLYLPTLSNNKIILECIKQILKLPFEYDLDMNDNFYSLGGDSLLLLKLISILRQKHAIFLDINELLYCQTISDIMSLTQNSSSDKIRYRILIFPALYGNMIPYQQFINEINKITKHIELINIEYPKIISIFSTLTEFTNYLRICYQSKYTTFPGITLMIGASFGGLVAYEFSKNLIDTHVFNIDGILNSSNNKSPTFEEHGDYIIKHLNKLIPSESNTFKSIIKQSWDLLQLSINYVPYYDTQKCMTLLVSNKSNEEAWSNYCVVSKYQLEGDHTQILSYPNIKLIMEVIKKKFFI